MKQLALILSLLLFSLPMRPDIAESGCLMKAVEAEELPCLNIPRAGHSLMVAGGEPVVVEEVPDGMFLENKAPIWAEFRSIADRDLPTAKFEFMEHEAFIDRCRRAYCVVQTGEKALYANIILRKGVVRG